MKKKSDKQVQGTNDCSILSKFSMTSLGYFDDPFVKHMVHKSVRRAPLINRGYYIRGKAVEFAISAFLHRFNGTRKHIVSLGAGFDTAYFRLKSRNQIEDVLFVEVDFLDVAVNKARIIQDREQLSSVICNESQKDVDIRENNYVILDYPDYKLLGVSLVQLDTLEACLLSVGLDETTPTLFLSECVLSYISEKRTSNLIWMLSQSYRNATFVLYEQMQPHDGFGKLMMSHFRKTGAPLLSLDKHPTKSDQINRFFRKGWQTVEAMDMNEFYFNILPLSERQRVEKLEVFDEHEEFHLKCGHYFLLLAQTSDSTSVPPAYLTQEVQSNASPTALPPLVARTIPSSIDDVGWRVHAHSCASVIDCTGRHWLIRIGGYGRNPVRGKGYSRLTSISLVPEDGGEVVHLLPEGDQLLDGGIFRSCCCIDSANESSFLLFGGRVSPLCPSRDLVELRLRHQLEDGVVAWHAECHRLGDDTMAGPSARWRHASCILRHNQRSFLLICGGRNSEGTVLNDVFLYDIDSNSWEACEPFPGGGRCSCQLTSLSDTECLLSCGIDENRVPSSQLWIFSIIDRSWRSVTVSGPHLLPRFSHTTHVVRRGTDSSQDDGILLVLIGGVGASRESPMPGLGLAIMQLNPQLATAMVVGEFPIDLSSIGEPAMLFDHGTVVTSDGRGIIVCGGGGNCFSFGTHLNEKLIFLDIGTLLDNSAKSGE